MRENTRAGRWHSPMAVTCLLLWLVAGGGSLLAQTTGTILGAVKDQTGAVLPGASITATNVETGSTRTTTTGGRGEYRLPALAVGTYDVQAEMSGFQTSVRKAVTLTVGREAVLEFSLAVGEVTTIVDVTGEAPLVEATTATLSGVVDQQQMKDIPLNARSFIELVPLQTGAVFAEAGNMDSASFGFGRKLSVVGTRFNANSFLLDGADINNVGGTAGSAAGTVAGVETVREFRVITNAYDAAYGRHTGAVVSAVTKSGTNEFHGSVFEFLRNDNLDAKLWEDNREGLPKPEFKRNQFGGSLGGPVFRDRTFFFGSYEGLRDNTGRTANYNVPGERLRRDLASGAVTVDPVVRPYLDKYLAYAPNVPCLNECFDAAAFPLDRPGAAPDRSFTLGSHSFPASETTDEDFFTVRIDNRISDSDSFFGRYNQDKAVKAFPPGFTTHEELSNTNRFSTLEETHIYSPVLLGKTHFSFNRTRIGTGDEINAGFEFPNNLVSFDGGTTVGRFTPPGLSAWGGDNQNPKDYVQNVFQSQEDFFYTAGRHSLKFGGNFSRTQLNDTSGFHDGGTFGFSTLRDFLNRAPNILSVTRPGSDTIRGSRLNLLGLYLQDDFSLRPGLTLNLGLRYEIISVPTEVNGKLSNVRDITEKHVNEVTPNTVDIGNPYFVNPSLRNFAPRVGFAWDPFGSGKTSVRGGFGIYHDQLFPGEWRSPLGRSAPFYAVSEPRSETGGIAGQPIDFPNAYLTQRAGLTAGVAQYDGFEWKASQPAVYKWSFGIQQEVLASTTVEAGYSGTRSTHLVRASIQLNTTPATTVNGKNFFLILQNPNNPNFGRFRWRTMDGTSDYHGLRLSVTKRFSHSFQLQSSYTFAKTIDDSSSYIGGTDIAGSSERAGYRREKEHSRSAFDVRNSWTTNFVVDLPGSRWNGAAGALLGGWSVSSILRLNSGEPFTVSATRPRIAVSGVTRNFINTAGSSIDLIPGGNNNPVNKGQPDNYIDVTQFAYPFANCMLQGNNAVVGSGCDAALPTGVSIGNLGRNTLSSPGIANVDFTLTKETALSRLREGASLEFRAEFFNLLNRPNFDQPSATLFERTGIRATGAGTITGTRNSTPARQIQFALRVAF